MTLPSQTESVPELCQSAHSSTLYLGRLDVKARPYGDLPYGYAISGAWRPYVAWT